MSTISALTYMALAIAPAFVQCALACGAPWGALTLGGAWRGRLPVALRGVAVLQAALLGGMSLAVLSRGGAIALDLPAWCYWAAMGLTALTFVGNSLTPSKPERRLWAPVTAGMLVTGLITGLT